MPPLVWIYNFKNSWMCNPVIVLGNQMARVIRCRSEGDSKRNYRVGKVIRTNGKGNSHKWRGISQKWRGFFPVFLSAIYSWSYSWWFCYVASAICVWINHYTTTATTPLVHYVPLVCDWTHKLACRTETNVAYKTINCYRDEVIAILGSGWLSIFLVFPFTGVIANYICYFCTMTSSNGNIYALALCAGNSPVTVTGEFPSQRPVTWSFDDLCLELTIVRLMISDAIAFVMTSW